MWICENSSLNRSYLGCLEFSGGKPWSEVSVSLSPFIVLYPNAVDWVAYKQKHLFLTYLETGQSKIKMPADLVSGENLLLGL